MNWAFVNPMKGNLWGGMENWMVRLCRELQRRGDACWVVGRAGSCWPDVCRENGIGFMPVMIGVDFHPWAIATFRHAFRKIQPDAVFVKGMRAARFARMGSARPAIAIKLPLDKNLRDEWEDRLSVKYCVDWILTDSRFRRDEFLGQLPWLTPDKIHAVHNGIDASSFQPMPGARAHTRDALGLPADAFVVVGSGRFRAHKRYDDAIRAFARADLGPSARLVVMGEGPEQENLRALARAERVADRVVFPGWRDDGMQLVSGADVFLHPSESEGFPNAVLEAMAFGVPVIAADAGGTVELVGGEEQGFVVKPGDIASMTRALRRLHESESLRRHMGTACAARVRAEFEVAVMADRIRSIMVETIARRCGRS